MKPSLTFSPTIPTWFKNFMYFVPRQSDEKWEYSATVGWLLIFTPAINKWIDNTLVRGNPEAEEIVSWVNEALLTIADFTLLLDDSELKTLHRRVKGLLK